MAVETNADVEERPTKELLNLKREKVSLSQLYLDPNNPRFGAGRFVPDDRIAEDGVQSEAQRKIEAIGIEDLLPKVRHYGFVPTDPIVVRRFGEDQYVVLEGNRRTATLKKLQKAYQAGETFDPDLLASIEAFEALVYEGDNPNIVWLVQGLRHMSGIKEWRPLQQAAFISKIEEQVQSQYGGRGRPPGIPTVARSAGVSVATASRLLKAYSAFIQAREDEDYGSTFADSEKGIDKFSMFTEAVFRNDTLQTWMGWNNTNRQFDNENNFKKFLSWITPPESGGQPRIVRALDARDILPGIVENSDLLRKFDNGTIDLAEANYELSQRRNATREPNLNSIHDQLQELLNAVDSLPMPQIVREGREEEFNKLLVTLKQSLDFQLQPHERQ